MHTSHTEQIYAYPGRVKSTSDNNQMCKSIQMEVCQILFSLLNRGRCQWRSQTRGGGGIFIYSCSQTVKRIDFKRNKLCKTRIYEYVPLPPHTHLSS